MFAILLLVVVSLVWLRGALFHRFILFPRQEEAWAHLRSSRVEPENPTAWKEFRGVIHSHSYLSHDSEVPFEHILAVMEETGTDFIAMSDHAGGEIE